MRNLQYTLPILLFLLVLPTLLGITAATPTSLTNSSMQTATSGSGSGVATPASYAPLPYSSTPPTLTPEQRATMEWGLTHSNFPGPALPASSLNQPAATPKQGTESYAASSLKSSPGTFWVFSNKINTGTSGSTSIVGEPATANNGPLVFYTGNWYASRSTNGGTSWTYVNPYADFASFCCDQDVQFDPGNFMFLWYRQGSIDTDPSVTNQFYISASHDASIWCTYAFRPTILGVGFTSTQWDYPQIALTNNNVYITTNLFSAGGSFLRTVIFRLHLAEMSTCTGVPYGFYSNTIDFTWVPTQGATDTMYWGSNWLINIGVPNNMFRIYSWPDSVPSSSIAAPTTITINAYNQGGRGAYTCATMGSDPCARMDFRVLSGWISRPGSLGSSLGWFWMGKQAVGSFPFPYSDAAVFTTSNLAYTNEPLVWNSAYAFIYPSAAPNEGGDLGINLWVTGGNFGPPVIFVGIDDAFNPTPPGWELAFVAASTNGPPASCINGVTNPCWGDYNRVRAFTSSGVKGDAWIGSSYVLNNHTGITVVEPHYFVFGREQNAPATISLFCNGDLTCTVSKSTGTITLAGQLLDAFAAPVSGNQVYLYAQVPGGVTWFLAVTFTSSGAGIYSIGPVSLPASTATGVYKLVVASAVTAGFPPSTYLATSPVVYLTITA